MTLKIFKQENLLSLQASKNVPTATPPAGQVTWKIHLPCSKIYLPCIFVWCLLPTDKKGPNAFFQASFI